VIGKTQEQPVPATRGTRVFGGFGYGFWQMVRVRPCPHSRRLVSLALALAAAVASSPSSSSSLGWRGTLYVSSQHREPAGPSVPARKSAAVTSAHMHANLHRKMARATPPFACASQSMPHVRAPSSRIPFELRADKSGGRGHGDEERVAYGNGTA